MLAEKEEMRDCVEHCRNLMKSFHVVGEENESKNTCYDLQQLTRSYNVIPMFIFFQSV